MSIWLPAWQVSAAGPMPGAAPRYSKDQLLNSIAQAFTWPHEQSKTTDESNRMAIVHPGKKSHSWSQQLGIASDTEGEGDIWDTVQTGATVAVVVVVGLRLVDFALAAVLL